MQERGTALKTLVITRPGCRYSRGTRLDSLSPSEKGKTRVSYFNFEFNSKMATSLVHTLNRPYKGARKFSATAPDAQGTLVIWARDTEECREHLLNALFDLIFARNRVGAAVSNPPCIFCGGKTQSRGRNSSGTRAWRCMNPDSSEASSSIGPSGEESTTRRNRRSLRFISWCSSMARRLGRRATLSASR